MRSVPSAMCRSMATRRLSQLLVTDTAHPDNEVRKVAKNGEGYASRFGPARGFARRWGGRTPLLPRSCAAWTVIHGVAVHRGDRCPPAADGPIGDAVNQTRVVEPNGPIAACRARFR